MADQRRRERLLWWFQRRPATVRALRRFRLHEAIRLAAGPKFAGLRTQLTTRPSVTAIGPRRVVRAVRGAVQAPADNPIGFPQDTDGSAWPLDVAVDSAGPSRREMRWLRRRGVVTLTPDRHTPTPDQLMAMARAGVVLTADPRVRLGDLPSPVVDQLRVEIDPTDHGARELQSIRLRREAWSATMPTPQVSVLLASRRPSDLLHAVTMVDRQRRCEVQLCVGLHGSGWDADLRSEIRDRFRGPMVFETFTDEVDLGSMLGQLAERADGRYLSKWDDDDLYGSSHLLDLAIAHTYSGAALVGKGAEFVHLEGPDVTIRRFAIGAERPAVNLAGGALLLEREGLRALGGWPSAVRGADQRLIDVVLADGGTVYRTHGFQFILRRRPPDRAGGHTWPVTDEYFLQDAVEQRAGLDLVFADVDAVGPPA